MALSNEALITLLQAKNYLRVDVAASLHIDAEYVGTGNGTTKVFNLANTPIEGSLKLYVHNVKTTDFTISGAVITFKVAPALNNVITASYDKAAATHTFEAWDDELLGSLIEAATRKAEDYTGRFFIQREITETHIGDGTQMLKLYRQPVIEVDSIKIDGEDLTEWIEKCSIGRVYHTLVWAQDAEIEITYTAGHGEDRATVQPLIPDAMLAVLIAIANWYENKLGLKSLNISGVGSMDYGEPSELPEASKKLLNRMRTNILC